jgi:S1-C subfamily serine protease
MLGGGVGMANMLRDFSKELADAVETAGRSVVRVEARRRLPASGVVWSTEGLIVTASHVVEREEEVMLGLPDGGETAATFVGRDPGTDLALLKANAKGLTVADWGDAAELRVGNIVLALGRPGRTVQATLGILSAGGGGWRTPLGGEIDLFLRTDALMAPGFSGGPLIGATGRVFGVNSSALSREAGIAVPTATIRRVVADLQAHGRIRRGYLGVGVQPVKLPANISERVGQEDGLMLISVAEGGPAHHAGLMLGDVLMALDGNPTRGMQDLLQLLSGEKVGTSAAAKIVRAGNVEERKVTVGERP